LQPSGSQLSGQVKSVQQSSPAPARHQQQHELGVTSNQAHFCSFLLFCQVPEPHLGTPVA
jgi:hypothetical protein